MTFVAQGKVRLYSMSLTEQGNGQFAGWVEERNPAIG
jgi:hypothetical protein